MSERRIDVEPGDSQRVEIGYLCSHGHYAFYADPEGTSCASKRIAGIFVEREPGMEFYEPYEAADEDGHVYFTSCGWSEEDYIQSLNEAEVSLESKIGYWRGE